MMGCIIREKNGKKKFPSFPLIGETDNHLWLQKLNKKKEAVKNITNRNN
jgi:hypothetical protein